MAGAYPDPPNHRIAYDRDGAKIVRLDENNNISEPSQGSVENLADESGSSVDVIGGNTAGREYIVFLLPAPFTITHYFFGEADANLDSAIGNKILESSDDSTNGLDGSWTSHGAFSTTYDADSDDWRDKITALDTPISAQSAIRFGYTPERSNGIRYLHLYGTYDSPPELRIWDPDTDQRVAPAHLDWGDAQRGTSDQRRFRVKNTSADERAESVVVSLEALTDTTPSNVDQHDLSDDDGSTWSASIDIGDLDPGEISGELLVRRDLQSDADLGVWALRMLAEATSWLVIS